MLRITSRLATIQDFLKLKDYAPWKKYRRNAKTSNFSLLFGCAPARFAATLRDSGFSEADCDELISGAGLTPILEKMRAEKPGMDLLDMKYLVCAQFMRDGFFKGYKGLEDRITREGEFASKKGYIRCWHGPVRHLPEMKYFSTDSRGMPKGADRDLWSKYYSELKNIAVNSAIQTLEVRIAFQTIHYLCDTVKKWRLKSFMFSMCHDSEDWVIYDDEEDLVLALIKYAAEYPREPINGIPMEMDFELANLSTEELRKTNYYHGGGGKKAGDIHEELRKYNEAHGTALELPPMPKE